MSLQKIFNFFRNIWFFRSQLSRFRWWDYSFTLEMLDRCLESMQSGMEKEGQEIGFTRMKKVESIERAREILKNMEDDNYQERAEEILGLQIIRQNIIWEKNSQGENFTGTFEKISEQESETNKKIIDLALKIEEDEWCEFCRILQGQRQEDFKGKTREEWEEWFDGSGMKGWWD